MGRKKWTINLAVKFWPLTHWAKRVGHRPPFKQLFSLIASEKAFRGSYIPVNEDIEIPPGVVAPRQLLIDYVKRSSYRAIAYECPCRLGEGCQQYPRDIGCMLLGNGAREMDPSVGYLATVEEALAHVNRALDAGLIPHLGNLKIDYYVYGINRRNRLITLCFCCTCCCVIHTEMRNLVIAFPNSLVKLEGVDVEVTDDCVGCGKCRDACFVEAIEIINGKSTVGERCKGCGVCVEICPHGARKISIQAGSRIQEVFVTRVGSDWDND